MAKENETVADIIAEMRGARTEFPFVYLMGEPDTPEVIDFETKEIIAPRKINIRRVMVKELADRLEAAYKRERKASGNAAKLREAMDYLCERMADIDATFDPSEVECLRAALAAPPRNCDRPECVTTKAAADVWRKEDGGKTAYHEWLLAPATEKEGGAK